MEYYLSAKKLIMMISLTTALLLPVTDALQSCNKTAPSSHGPCKGHYAACVKTVLRKLLENTPYAAEYTFTTSDPNGNPSGGFRGHAICVRTSSQADCRSCLRGAEEWLSDYCANKDHSKVMTTAVAKDGQYCSKKAPLHHGPCRNDYAACVDMVLDSLQGNTIYYDDYDSQSYAAYPKGHPSGGFRGQSACHSESGQAGCRSWRQWVAARAGYSASGRYSYGSCSMSFEQIP